MLIGIDPANGYTGLAVVAPDYSNPLAKPPLLLDLQRVRGTGEPREYAREIIRRALVKGSGHATWRIERPPPDARGDVEHGPQAAIGWALGYLTGLIVGSFSLGAEIELVEVSPWREAMCSLSTLWGVRAAPPGAREPTAPLQGDREAGREQSALVERVVDAGDGRTFKLSWSGCGHQSGPFTFAELQGQSPKRCPGCQVLPVVPIERKVSRAEWKREAWKALACGTVAAHWPDRYAALVAEARGRVRDESKPDHQLAGVSDACEAVWIAVSKLTEAP